MGRETVATALKQAINGQFKVVAEPQLSYPDPQFGDLSTNVSFQIATDLKQRPQLIAEQIVAGFKHPLVKRSEAVNGFINIWLTEAALIDELLGVDKAGAKYGASQLYQGQDILIEYTDPNPFKEFHIGHLYSNSVGEAIARLYEFNGARVHRLCYQGDVGLHVAKALWGLQRKSIELSASDSTTVNAQRLGEAYAVGATAYESDEAARADIKAINQSVYELNDPAIKRLYEQGRQISLDYFVTIYQRLGADFEHFYYERQSGEKGLKIVKAHLKDGLFESSDGAVVYRGEQDGLHTRVFVNAQGLPTYEAKDLGLAYLKDEDYPQASRSIIITANEVDAYFKVVLAVLKRLKPDLAAKTVHLSHGVVKLATGKMSSRSGNIVTASDLIDQVTKLTAKRAVTKAVAGASALAAIKYALLRSAVGKDIIFDPKQATAIEGDSGPYLQYAYARSVSLLTKAGKAKAAMPPSSLSDDERQLILKISQFDQVVKLATERAEPHLICAYLSDLAQLFSKFYQSTRIIGSSSQGWGLKLVKVTGQTLKSGLSLLNIDAPSKM